MNKPIRTISIFCLLLFLALMLNATYLQYWQAGEPQRGPAQPPGARRGVLPRARRDPGRRADAGRRAERASRRPVRVPARLPAALQVRPRSPAASPTSARPGSSAPRTPCSPATTRGCSSPGWSTCSATPAQGRQRPAHHRPARRRRRRSTGLAAPRRGRRGRRGGDRADAPAGSWRWCRCRRTTPTSWPATTSARSPSRPTSGSTSDDDRAAAQPRDPDPAAARLDVQAGHRGGGASSPATTTPTRWCPAARPTSCRRPPARPA